jgi:hypothetical protein
MVFLCIANARRVSGSRSSSSNSSRVFEPYPLCRWKQFVEINIHYGLCTNFNPNNSWRMTSYFVSHFILSDGRKQITWFYISDVPKSGLQLLGICAVCVNFPGEFDSSGRFRLFEDESSRLVARKRKITRLYHLVSYLGLYKGDVLFNFIFEPNFLWGLYYPRILQNTYICVCVL